MSQPYILLVEDEPHIATALIYNLEQEGFTVRHVASGEEALELVPWAGCQLVVLDLMLPGIDGLQVCRRLRDLDARLPVLMLTAMNKEPDRVAGLQAGADDYLAKPFSLAEFLLRVQGMLRRSSWYRLPGQADIGIRFGGNEIDLNEGRARTPRGDIVLTELEVRMLRFFFQNEDRLLTREELLTAVWGLNPETETRTLDNFIVRMRKYFETTPNRPEHFLTVRGRGYRFSRQGRKK